MKKYNLILLLSLLVTMSSCDKWFDVSPKSTAKADDLFKQEGGFRDVLIGVYSDMRSSNTYGMQLTFGYMDALAQYYDEIGTDHLFTTTVEFKYDEPFDEGVLKGMWSNQYKCIVNLNIMLEYIDQKKSVFSSDLAYNMYKGEALALRAMLHFDLLRLFAPAPVTGMDQKAIPYMTVYANVSQPHLTVGDVLDKIVGDLNSARDLMRDFDYWGPNYGKVREKYSSLPDLSDRGKHLNYYAATALLARVQMYAGNATEALTAAKEIIREPGDEPVYPFKLVTGGSTTDRLFMSECLFALDFVLLKDIISPYFGEKAIEGGLLQSSTILAFSKANWDGLYVGDAEYRKDWYKGMDAIVGIPGKYDGMRMMPLIRLSELYFIAAEATGGTIGLEYLNKIRAHRGLTALGADINLEEEIYKEYCKEFFCEGQMFYYFKRKNQQTMGVFKQVTIDPKKVYVLPLPLGEQDFGKL